MSWFELALCLFAIATATTTAITAITTLVHYRWRPAPSDAALRAAFPRGLPKVTIFKPCKGADPSLYENLASFMRLDGVPYEVLIGIADRNDPAVQIAQRIIRDFPDRDVRLHFTGDRHAHNPKVINLCHLEQHARGEFFWIADSNVRVRPDLLRRLMAAFRDPDVALSYAMFRGVPGRGVGAHMQAAIFDTLGLPSIAVAYRLFGIGNLVGKSFVVRRSALEAMGGFRRYDRYLIEDGLMGRDIRAHGFRSHLVDDVVDVHLGEMTPRFVWAQEMRWAVLHKMAFTLLPIGEMIWNPWFVATLAVLAAVLGYPVATGLLAAAAVHNLLIDLLPYVRFGGRARDLWVLALADLLMYAIVLTVWFHRDVVWRGQRFTLGLHTFILAAEKVGAPAHGGMGQVVSLAEHAAHHAQPAEAPADVASASGGRQ